MIDDESRGLDLSDVSNNKILSAAESEVLAVFASKLKRD